MSSQSFAILGGQPVFDSPVHVGTPNLGDLPLFHKHLEEIFSRRWLSNDGPVVRLFEQKLSEILDVKHCIAVTNGTVAIELVAVSLGWRGRVVVPGFTFVASAHALAWVGVEPVFCDVDPKWHNLDSEDVRHNIDAAAGILGVHLWGRPADEQALQDEAQRLSADLVFDASHAFGSRRRGKSAAAMGRAATFSFHATKFVNTFEGGLITTNDDALADDLRSRRNFGHDEQRVVQRLGTNAKLNEVSAAMGLACLPHLDEWIDHDKEMTAAYHRHLSTIPGIRVHVDDEETDSNNQYLVVETEPDVFGLSRDELLDILVAENIGARKYFSPGIHRVPPYAADLARSLPVTERLSDIVLQLPTGAAVTRADVTLITDVIERAHAEAESLRGHLRGTSV